MANKKISDFTAATTLADGDLFELETAGGNSRKITKANLLNPGLMRGEAAWTKPTLTTLSTTRAGTGTVENSTNGVRLRAPGTSSNSNSLIYALQSYSTGASGCRATARFRSPTPLMNWGAMGMILRNSSSGNSRLYWRGYDTVQGFNRNTYTNDTTWASVTGLVASSFPDEWWMCIRDDLTNHYIEISTDGQYWQEIYREARTTHMTPDQVGVFLNPNYGQTSSGLNAGIANIRNEVYLECVSWLFETLP